MASIATLDSAASGAHPPAQARRLSPSIPLHPPRLFPPTSANADGPEQAEVHAE